MSVQHIHHTFAAIAFRQTFAVDDLLEGLAFMRENQLRHLDSETKSLRDAIASGERVFSLQPNFTNEMMEDLSETHNALLFLQKMKEDGVKEVTLYLNKDLRHQILAMDSSWFHLQQKYKRKLTNG